jgi:hypothetical protein
MRNWINLIVENEKNYSLLYHCTPLSNLDKIAKHGLDPSYSKWSDCVYLAGDEAHAQAYDRHHGVQDTIMLAIDISALDINKLKPDNVDLPDCLNDPDDWEQYDWKESLQICGQCCYDGVIPPFSIRKKTPEGWETI